MQNTNRILIMQRGRIVKELQTDCTNEDELNRVITMAKAEEDAKI